MISDPEDSFASDVVHSDTHQFCCFDSNLFINIKHWFGIDVNTGVASSVTKA